MARKKSNRSDFNAASGNVFAPVPHSGLDHWPSAFNKVGGPKKEVRTSDSYSKPNSGPYHPGIGNPTGVNKAEVKSPMGMPAKLTGPYHKGMGNPVEPKKWHKKGYNMSLPTTGADQ